MEPAVSDATIVQWWAVALGLAFVVTLVVAGLLELIVRTAGRILDGVQAIWTGGKRIAGNTVTIALLQRTNDLAAALLSAGGGIAESAARIRQAAGGGR